MKNKKIKDELKKHESEFIHIKKKTVLYIVTSVFWIYILISTITMLVIKGNTMFLSWWGLGAFLAVVFGMISPVVLLIMIYEDVL